MIWEPVPEHEFIRKFLMDEVKTLDGLIIGHYNVLTLTGFTMDNEVFIGNQEIKVINVVPKGKK
jgi:hypothetical protein